MTTRKPRSKRPSEPTGRAGATRNPARTPSTAQRPAPSSSSSLSPSSSPSSSPSPELIAVEAFLIWERKGRPHGQALEHWLEAEQQLRSQPASA